MPAFPYLFSNSIFRVNLITIAMMILAGLVVLIVLRLSIRKLDMRNPRGLQNLIEWAIDFTANMARDTMPSEQVVQWILPLAFTMMAFLFVSNWLGLVATIAIHQQQPIPWLGITAQSLAMAHGEVPLFDSPTANMSMTLGMALMVWVLSHATGLRRPKQYLWHFVKNPLGIMEEFTNPLTHGMRLFGNIFAGEALAGAILTMPMLFGVVPTGFPFLLVWLLYSGFVSTIQAYIFTILMTLYVGQKSFHGGVHHT